VVCPRVSVVLLAVFIVLAQERNVTRAATRLLLSQPAVSRALQRLRDMFHDDLLIRSSSGYEPTPNGQRLLDELETSLPRLDRLPSGSDFDPATEETSFRIAATDHACHVVCPLLCRTVLAPGVRVFFDFLPLHDGQFEELEKGRLDLPDAPAGKTLLNHCGSRTHAKNCSCQHSRQTRS
jgi:DNA-binding transcriptional LysR family regulator